MKNIYTIAISAVLLIVALDAPVAQAQSHNKKLATSNTAPFSADRLPHRISAHYSDGLYSLGGLMGQALLLNILGAEIENIDGFGAVGASYHFLSRSERWAYGVNVGYMPITYTQKINGQRTSFSEHMVGVMPEVQCFYTRKGIVRLYGSVGVGLSMMIGGGVTTAMDWQFNPIGVRIGSNRVAGFLSLGIGTRGLLSAGVQVGL